MVTTIIVLLPLVCPQNTTNWNRNCSLIVLKKYQLHGRFVFRLNFSQSAVMNLAADVLQLNLNAESKETGARRKCPEAGSPSRIGPAQ